MREKKPPSKNNKNLEEVIMRITADMAAAMKQHFASHIEECIKIATADYVHNFGGNPDLVDGSETKIGEQISIAMVPVTRNSNTKLKWEVTFTLPDVETKEAPAPKEKKERKAKAAAPAAAPAAVEEEPVDSILNTEEMIPDSNLDADSGLEAEEEAAA